MRSFGVNNRLGYLSSSTSTRAMFVAHRWFWVVMSAVIAAQVPRFGDYLGLIGALANALVSPTPTPTPAPTPNPNH